MGRVYLPPYVLVAVALLAALGALMTLVRPSAGAEPAAAAAPVPRAAVVEPRPVALLAAARSAPVPAAAGAEAEVAPAPPSPGRVVIRPRPGREIVVRARPRGPVVARLGARTEFGSPTTLLVAARRGAWLGVVTTHVANGRLGWVDARADTFAEWRTRVRVTIDLSDRRLVVRRGDRVLRRITVGIGRPSSPTPVGRFAVTDKLPGSRYGSYYGCCILALSAHQPNLPPGWTGGDRIAVHGTNDPGSIGTASSAGCPRARDADLRYLLRVVPLGAPVTVRV
jgi:lipoprotein-anchoring transpeptidase ErfK/SrfK